MPKYNNPFIYQNIPINNSQIQYYNNIQINNYNNLIKQLNK